MSGAPTYQPRCEVIISPGLTKRYQPPELEYIGNLDATPNLVSCRCDNALNAPAGTFQFDLTYERRHLAGQLGLPLAQTWSWNEVIWPDNMVRISFSRVAALPARH